MGNRASILSTVLCSLGASDCGAPVRIASEQYAECSTSWPGWSGVKYMFTFGDSYSATGFDVGGTQPSIANPMGNPIYPGWTSSGGANWIDFLTFTYNTSTFLNYNFADGGATVDSALIQPWKPTVQSLKDQVHKRYLPTYAKKPSFAPWSAGNSLFEFWIGINDVGYTYWDGNDSRVDTAFQIYRGLLEEVYETGARNFLFLNVPPLQRAPLTTQNSNGEAVSREEIAIHSWNSKLEKMVASLRLAHPSMTVSVFDVHQVYDKVLNDPSTYVQTAVLKSTKDFCAGYSTTPPSLTVPVSGCNYTMGQYFWLNNLHPTFTVHNATAAELSKFLAASPPNVSKRCDGRPYQGRIVKKERWRS